MSTIAVLITDQFEDVEYTKPAEAFKDAGHELVHVGLRKETTVKGKKNETPVTIDIDFNKASVDDYDAIFIPGGYSPDKLRAHQNAVDFIKTAAKKEKIFFLICHAAQLLISADVLKNRTVTGWKSIIQDIKNAGATYVDEEVVIDDNLISSRSPKDLSAFINASLKKLKEEKKAKGE